MRPSSKLEKLLEQLSALSDEELRQLEIAASQELLDRELRQREQEELLKATGCTPLYRCQKAEHQKYGLYAEDPERPGYLTCGCRKEEAELSSFE
jgi:hypothetical protein